MSKTEHWHLFLFKKLDCFRIFSHMEYKNVVVFADYLVAHHCTHTLDSRRELILLDAKRMGPKTMHYICKLNIFGQKV